MIIIVARHHSTSRAALSLCLVFEILFGWMEVNQKMIHEQHNHNHNHNITTATTQVDIRTLTPTYVHIVAT